ncbi:MAG: hypothetical protein ACJ76N_29535 [Thermoanaerobaculia bacterium]
MNSQFRPTPWRQLLQSGFETHLYEFEDLPTGTRRVVLENATWHPGQRVPAVVWFLRDLDSEQRYRISIFQNRQRNGYGPVEGLDLAGVPPGASLAVEIHQNGTGTFRIVGAQVLSLPDA